MADGYRIIGAEMSPYSVKVRSYFRYKGIPHPMDPAQCREPGGIREIRKNADHPVGGNARRYWHPGFHTDHRQDREASPRAVYPPRRARHKFISALIEEFGDEWGNKWMFHYRWAREIDQRCSAGRIARMRAPQASEEEHDAFADRFASAWWTGSGIVGSNE